MDTVKKKIGFFSGGNDAEYNGKIVDGMQEACMDYGIEMYAFTSIMKTMPDYMNDVQPENILRGENQIFELVDYNDIDGVVVLAHEFLEDAAMYRIIDRAKNAGKPVVIIDGEAEGCYSVLFSDESSMEDMVRHVVEFHHAKKINFISGFEGNRQSDERLEAYKKVLTENNIPIEEKRIGYGYFGAPAKDVMIDFVNSGLEFPDAIICANDIMAITAIGFLYDIGKNVPGDVIVTGFDGIMNGQVFCPALTSVRRAVYESGGEAVKVLKQIWEGNSPEKITYCKPIVIKNQSCGCRSMNRIDVSEYYKIQDDTVNEYKSFNHDFNIIINEVSKATSIEDIILKMYSNSTSFDVKNYYVCLNDVLVQNPEEFFDTAETDYDYSEGMIAYYLGDDGELLSENFPVWQLIPKACRDNEERHFCHFVPLFFMEKTLGYVILKINEYPQNMALLFTYLRTVSNSIGDICLKKRMEIMVSKLGFLSERDPLTSLYNRRGLMAEGERIVQKNKTSGKYIFGIGIDLDGLKVINDTYGHEEGDNAISQVANAILFAKHDADVCSRTGGDEFFVLGICKAREEAEAVITGIHSFLKEYNLNSRKVYEVDCSCGLYIAPAARVKTFESVMKFADQVMYSVKSNKKAAKIKK